MPGSSAAPAANKPSAKCTVTSSAAAEKAIQAAAAEGAHQDSAAVATAEGESTKPLAFYLGTSKGKGGSAGDHGKHKRSLSLASILEDVFEEVINTPPSTKRKRKRRKFGSTKAKSGGEATPAIDLTASDNEGGAEAVIDLSSPSKVPPQKAPPLLPPALSRDAAQRQAAEASDVGQAGCAAACNGPSAASPAAHLPKLTARRASGQPEAPSPPLQASEPVQMQLATGLPLADNAPAPPEEPPPPPPLESSSPQATSSAGLTAAAPLATAPEAAVLFPSPGSGLICACSAQEADESFNRHRLPLPQQLRAAHPGAVIAQGTRVFLHNADTRRLLGPFYAMRTAAREDKVHVVEREPVQALREVDVLEKLTPKMEHLSDLGPVIESSVCEQISSVFQKAAIPNRVQPYRMLGEKLGGAVFVCSAGTIQSSLQMGLLGMMQDTFVPIVQHISVGMPIFLFNHSDRTLLGPLSAISPGDMYIDEKAWARPGHRSQWPAQVRIAVHHPIIALQEKVFKPLIKSAYYNSSTFHFDLTTTEALRLLDAFTRRQVMYHQHLQHRQGHAYFVPPAMCQQLLEDARRACRPPPQLARHIPRQPQQQLPHTNAYLAVLESGLSTQKKPPRQMEGAPPPEPPPPLSEILGREPGEILSEDAVPRGGMLAPSSAAAAEVATSKEAAALAAEESLNKSAKEGQSASGGPADEINLSGNSGGAVLLGQSLSLQSKEGELGTRNTSGEQGKQAEIGARSGSRLLEKFDAARKAQGTPSGPPPTTGGAPALGAAPAKPSPLSRQQVPLLSPLVLATAPSHTPFPGAASSAPDAPAHSLSFGQAAQLPAQGGKAQQASTELPPVLGTGPEQALAAHAAGAAGSFTFQVPGSPLRTPPSFARLLQEYASTCSEAPAPRQLKQNPGLPRKRGKRRKGKKQMKEVSEAAVVPDARSDTMASDGSAALADQATAAAPAQPHAPLQSSMPGVTVLEQVSATAWPLALASSTAPSVADGFDAGHLAPANPSGPQLLSNGRKSTGTLAMAKPQSSTEGQQLGSSSQPPSRGGGAAPEQPATCDALLDASLAGVIQEAAQAGRELPPKRRRRLALALQKAAHAASALHRALQAAGGILRANPEGLQLSAQSLPPAPAGLPPASARAEAARPESASGQVPVQAVSGAPSSALVTLPSRAARRGPQPAATMKRSRLQYESSAAESGSGAVKAKKQKCAERVTPLASAAQLAGLLSSAAGLDGVAQPEQQMLAEPAPPPGRPAVQQAKSRSAAPPDGAAAGKKQKGLADTAAPDPSTAARLPSLPAEQAPVLLRQGMRPSQQLLAGKIAPRGKPVGKQTVQEAALSALKRLREASAAAEAQAAEVDGSASEAQGAGDTAPAEAPAAVDTAVRAPDMLADSLGIASEDSSGQELASDGARISSPLGPPPSPPAKATFPVGASQPGSGQPEPASPLQHPGGGPRRQAPPAQQAPTGALPQHGAPQHGALLGMSAPSSAAPNMLHNCLAPWQQPHMQQQLPRPQGALGPPLGHPPALQPPFLPSHPHQPHLHGPGPWLHQQRPGMLWQHPQQLWGLNGPPGPHPAHFNPPMQPQWQPRGPFGPPMGNLALLGPPQTGINGGFQFRAGQVAGQVGSAVVQSNHNVRCMQLKRLQKQLKAERARFLQWHAGELSRVKATGKEETVKAKQTEVETLTLQFGDPKTLKKVKAAGRAALLELASSGGSAKSGAMSGAAGQQGGDAAAEGLADGTAEGHEICQATPLPPSVGAKRKHLPNGHPSKLVAFDTNVYIGNNAKDPKVITQVLKRWSLISPSIVVLVPIVVMSELNKLATFNNKIGELATAGLKILQTVLNSKIAHVQLPDELPEGCTTNRIKDDGILDCLRHFKEAGYHIFLCTRDKQFACRSQAQGIEAVSPDTLAMQPEYPLQVEMTPMPLNKRRKTAQDAAAQLPQAPADGARLPEAPANGSQLLQAPANDPQLPQALAQGGQLPQVPQHEFIAL